MSAVDNTRGDWRGRMRLAQRAFEAWWEGYAFDPALEKARLAEQSAFGPDAASFIPELIWGEGRLEPGDPAWMMRQARALGLPPKSSVVVLGAGAGAPLRDLGIGARWKTTGFARTASRRRGLRVRAYEEAMAKARRGQMDGALALFELHRDPDPAAFTRFAADLLKMGAPAAFIDFALPRSGTRHRACFNELAPGSPRPLADYNRALREAGLAPGEPADETRVFAGLIAKGWMNWRRAYNAASACAPGSVQRAETLRYLGQYADLWAERFDALKGGSLQVLRIPVRKVL